MSAFSTELQQLLVRDLRKLEKELSLYPDDASVWKTGGQITNTAGNLCLHLCGNLQTFIGALLGNTGYQRNRDAEFALKGLSRQELYAGIHATIAAVEKTLPTITDAQWDAPYPQEVLGYPMTTRHFLVHLSAHLGYHLGQVNYHRRLLA